MFIEPVFGKKFFGREEVLATLNKRVTALKGGYRQNLALTGPMLSGKSSILRHFLKNIKDHDVIPLYIEMGDDDFKVFGTRFMASLLFQYLNRAGADKKEEKDFEELKKICRPLIPATVNHIDSILCDIKHKRDDEAYSKLLAITSVFKEETGKSCIVILDEFHKLSYFHLKKPFQVFGRYIMVQKDTMYIVSSSQKTLMKEILVKKLSLLFGNFEMIDIEGFDNHIARSFIADKVKDSPLSDGITDYLILISKGNPFYLEVMAKRFAEIIKKSDDRSNDKECLLEALADLLYRSDGILNQYFTNTVNFFLEKKARKSLFPALIAMASGASTMKAIIKSLGRGDKMLGDNLTKLKSMDLVHSSGVFYKISDRLFEFWLKNVYALKSRCAVDDMDIKYLEFKNAVESDFEDFLKCPAKSVKEVACGLFSSFDGEMVRVSMNDRKLPRFDSVTSRTIPGNIFEVTGYLKNRSWVLRIKQNDITSEHDISDFGGHKPETLDAKIARKIFVSLKGIDENACLLAKERDIWTWDMEQLNDMLRMFGKYELVI